MSWIFLLNHLKKLVSQSKLSILLSTKSQTNQPNALDIILLGWDIIQFGQLAELCKPVAITIRVFGITGDEGIPQADGHGDRSNGSPNGRPTAENRWAGGPHDIPKQKVWSPRWAPKTYRVVAQSGAQSGRPKWRPKWRPKCRPK